MVVAAISIMIFTLIITTSHKKAKRNNNTYTSTEIPGSCHLHIFHQTTGWRLIGIYHTSHAAIGNEQIEELLILSIRRAHALVEGLITNNGSHSTIRRKGWPSIEALGEVVSGGGEITNGRRALEGRNAPGTVTGGALPKPHVNVARLAVTSSQKDLGVDCLGIREFGRGRVENIGLAECAGLVHDR